MELSSAHLDSHFISSKHNQTPVVFHYNQARFLSESKCERHTKQQMIKISSFWKMFIFKMSVVIETKGFLFTPTGKNIILNLHYSCLNQWSHTEVLWHRCILQSPTHFLYMATSKHRRMLMWNSQTGCAKSFLAYLLHLLSWTLLPSPTAPLGKLFNSQTKLRPPC